MSDEKFLKKVFKLRLGRKLDLENPQTFNEKLQWLKLYDRKPIYTTMVDKYKVKKYVADIIGEEYIIPTIGVWNNFDEIDFDALPNQFVLKCTHDSGGLIICRDKSKLDINAAREKINKALRRDYYLYSREWPYKAVKPRIIAENYMEDTKTAELRDYKFFCFDGEVKAMFIATDRASKIEETKFDFFDENYNHLPFTNGHPNADVLPEKPEKFELMKELASKLSKGIPYLRVDFYEVDGKIYFGELTFYHWSGFVPFEPTQWDYTLGEWITLPEKTEEK
ncbi:MAG: glycosyl transferase [Clostridia bacterium]|nr:glycosyl transferase [Clostridia bacterium]